MWTSRMIIYRSRAWKYPFNNGIQRVGATWVYDAYDDSLRGDSREVGNRCFSFGRRYGWKGPGEKKEKKGITKETLEKAAKGELSRKHGSGIPRTAARKHKGHSVHGNEEPGRNLEEVALEELEYMSPDFDASDSEGDDLVTTLERDVSAARAAPASGAQTASSRTRVSGSGDSSRGPGDVTVTVKNFDSAKPEVTFRNIQRHPLQDPEYWREEDYDIHLTEEDKAFIAELAQQEPSAGSEDVAAADSDDIDFKEFFNSIDWDSVDDVPEEEIVGKSDEVEEGKSASTRQKRRSASHDVRDERRHVSPKDRPAWYESVSTLEDVGEDGDDFWKAMLKHPTHYAEARHYNLHHESKRVPQPYYPPNRMQPPSDFVETFMRFAYVTGLPPALSEEGMSFGKTNLNTLQQQDIQKNVTRLFGIGADQVFPANETSAYVGFDSPEERNDFLKAGPKDKELVRPVKISKYSPSSEEEETRFVKEATPGTLVKLENVPPGHFSRATLARDLFPKESEFSAAYRISPENVVFPSPTTALLRFDSAEQTESALTSDFVASQLENLGRYPVRIFKAKREIIYDRMGGPAKQTEIWKLGPKIIVDGDMPSKHFYLSHAGTVLLRGLDRASVTKESITEFFQPFSRTIRDVKGSIEFVTCEGGLPTDKAYVGFDFLGEAEAAMNAFSGRAKIGDNIVKMKLLKDRWMPNAPKRQQRPERTQQEILKNLNDWEQYVDPEDIKYLEENGVPKQVLGESLRGIRFNNRSFGSLDWAMPGEKLEPEKESGDDYRELVQMYVAQLKECIATPENPGESFKGLHFPGEPLDLSIFEKETKRVQDLLKRREGL